MKIKRIMVLLLGLAFFCGSSVLFSQEEEEEGHVYAISTFKVRFDQVEEFLDLWEKEYHPIDMQNEYILSTKTLTHLWGPDWSVVMITEYEKFEDIAAAWEKSNELFEKKYPKESQRDKITKKILSYRMGHWDAIVQEVPKLTK